MRHLAEQNYLLHRPPAGDIQRRCALFAPNTCVPPPSSDSPNVSGFVGLVESQTVRMADAFFLTRLVGNTYSQVSMVSTLATNILATSLVGYKAWSVLLTQFSFRSNTHR